MSKYIIFKADKGQLKNWEKMLLSHTGACTNILAEHYDGSKKPIPEPGYRLKEFSQIEEYVDSEFPGASTHYRIGDWEVSKVEEYVPDLPLGTFESVVICYCRYSPVNTPLKPLPKIQVSPSLKIEA
ncbi:hypothetical protein [Dolichospermum flos-aquae]|uniref:Uncharacterized protein n=1 Tax=Dolichospermum flos-aquae LEGE 04289 TaxID=1828708 RepID=A0ACC5Q028_DOLFA|nr:hypothetical protein [Dolichospermum flos-aquae]MBE9218496.1 hypothetical protein [Dolichospermum flos-aquae LEGE 04289]